MFKNSKFWKSPARLTGWLTVLVVLAILLSGCNKLEKLKGQAEEAEREFIALEMAKADIQAKIDHLAELERQVPEPNLAIAQENGFINDERADLKTKNEKLDKKLDAIVKQVQELSNVELGEVGEYAGDHFPKLGIELTKKGIKLSSDVNDLQQGARSKLQSYITTLDNEVNVINQLVLLPPSDPCHDVLLAQLSDLRAQAFGTDLTHELDLAGGMVEEFRHVGAVPVVAGTDVNQCTFEIKEGYPPGLEQLDDGVLAPGTAIIFQLHPSWMLKASATITSDNNNLSFVTCGNQSGSSMMVILVTDANDPNRTDNSFTIRLNGIHIGNVTGIVRATLAVIPGRCSSQEFLVLPPGCLADPPTCAQPIPGDLNNDHIVNFKDFAIFANGWLSVW